MLMDEPFGAIDPISRERLQDEFLALQERIRKTVVFVTHDIDEAIKVGDRIAIMREGGHLVQYGTAAEVLTRPADDFVARFVGADRGLKRLSLTTVGELPLEVGDADETVPAGMSARDALSLILTQGGRPLSVEGRGIVTLETIAQALAEEARA
jgi:osmoprotectant transport system ATP-binding protein